MPEKKYTSLIVLRAYHGRRTNNNNNKNIIIIIHDFS